MKPRQSNEQKKVQRRNSSKNVGPNPVDQLGIERGQNAEKGNTVNPRNVRARHAKEAAH